MTDNNLDAFDIDNLADVLSEAPKALIEQLVDELTELGIGVSRLIQIADALEINASSLIDGLSAHQDTPSMATLDFHNTPAAYKMTKAMSGLSKASQHALCDLAIALTYDETVNVGTAIHGVLESNA